MKVAIIGLGLIGGSIARRLRGFHNCTISAYNRTSETVLLAKQDGAIDEGSSDVGEVMDNADLIILCLYGKKQLAAHQTGCGYNRRFRC